MLGSILIKVDRNALIYNDRPLLENCIHRENWRIRGCGRNREI